MNYIREALEVITGKEPPDFVFGPDLSNLTDDEHFQLQEWAADVIMDKCEWMTGIGVLEAAEHMVKCAYQNGNI